MGLTQDVTNTQTGGIVKSINQPEAGTIKPATPQGNTEQAPVEQTQTASSPDVKGASWQGLYSFVDSSEEFGTDLSFDQFVGKYANDEASLKKLYTTIQLNSTTGTPFQSQNWNDFKANEYNNYFGYSVQPENTQSSNPLAQITDPSVPLTAQQKFDQAEFLPAEETIGQNLNIGQESPEAKVPEWFQAPDKTRAEVNSDVMSNPDIPMLGQDLKTTMDQNKKVIENFVKFKEENPDLYISETKKMVDKETADMIDSNTRVLVDRYSAQFNVSKDVVEKNLPDWAVRHSMTDPYGENISDQDKSTGMLAVRDKLANDAISASANELMDKKIKEIQDSGNVNEASAIKYFHKKMDEIGIDFLSVDELKIKALKEDINQLRSIPEKTSADQIKIKQKTSELNSLLSSSDLEGTKELYDPKTGKFVSGNQITDSAKEFNEKINAATQKYQNTDLGNLRKKRDELYFQFQTYVNEYVLKYARTSYDGGYNTDPDAIDTPEKKKSLALDRYSKKELGFSLGDYSGGGDALRIINSGVFPEHINAAANDMLANFIAVNKLLNLNIDPGTVQEQGFFGSVGEGISKGFGYVPETQSALADRSISQLESMGYTVTPEQAEKLDKNLIQQLGDAVGSTIAVSAEIGLNMILGNKLAAATKIPQLAKVIAGGNKTSQFILNSIYQTGIQTASFVAAGESASSGIGESVGQIIAGAVLNKFKVTTKAIRVPVRIVSGGITETFTEYSGQMVEALNENGLNISEAANQVFGETSDEVGRNLAITGMISLLFSVPGSIIGESKSANIFAEINSSESIDPAIQELKKYNIGAKPKASDVKEVNEIKEKQSSGEELTEIEFEKLSIANTKEEYESKVLNNTTEETDATFDFSGGITEGKPADNVVADTEVKTEEVSTPVDIKPDPVKSEIKPSKIKKEKNVVKEKPVAKTPDPVVEPVATGGTTGTEDNRGEEQVAPRVEPEKSVDKKVRPVISERKLSTPVKKESPVVKKQKQLTKEQNETVSNLDADKVESLKKKLGIEGGTAKGKAVQRIFSEKGGDINDFISAVEEVEKEGVQTYAQKRAEFDAVFNEAEKNRKSGNSEKAVELYNKAKEIMPDQSDRIDVAIDVAKSEVIDAKSIKLKEDVAADDAAKLEEESVKNLNDARSSLIDSDVTAIASNKAGSKRSVSGKVLSVNRTSNNSEYELLIDNGDGKSASKAKYNTVTKETVLIPQEKSDQISNKSNFDASSERKNRLAPEQKKKKQDEIIEELTDKIYVSSDSAGSKVVFNITDKGKIRGVKKEFKSLLKKIAYAMSEKANPQYISDLYSDLNGLIKDNDPIADIKVKKKIKNMIDSLSDSDSSNESSAEKEAAKTAEKVEDVVKKEKKATVKKEVAKKKVKSTGNKSVDSVSSKIVNIRNEAGSRLIDFKTEMKPILDELISLKDNGSISDLEYNNLYSEYFNNAKEITVLNKDFQSAKKAEDKKAIKAALKSNKPTLDDAWESDFDESYQVVETPGSSSNYTHARIASRKVTVKEHKSFIKKFIENNITGKKSRFISRKKIYSDLIKKVKVTVFEEGFWKPKIVDGKIVKTPEGKKVYVKPKWIGRFKKSENYIRLRGKGDIDTMIHEIGHAIAHRFGLNEAVNTGLADSELKKLWIFGSNPPKSMKKSDALNYKRQEGLAEFIRSYSINPEMTSINFPQLTQLYNDRVSSDVKKAVEDFGVEYSHIDSATDADLMKMMYNTQDYIDKYLMQEKWYNRAGKNIKLAWNNRGWQNRSVNDKHGRITMGWFSMFHTSVIEKTGALGATVRFLQKKGVNFLHGNNPYILIRNMSNYSQTRFQNLLRDGLVDVYQRRVTTKSGHLMNFDWLFEPLGGDLNRTADLVSDYLIAKQVVYKIDNGEVQVVSHKLGTDFTEDVLKRRIQQIEDLANTNPELHANVMEAASRWQEMALQTVNYRYEQGLITKERFDEISKGQDNYVALMRDMDEFVTDSIRKKQSTQRKAQEVHKQEGSEKTIENPYASLTSLIMEAYYEGDRNHAVSSLVDGLSQMKGEIHETKRNGLKELQYFKDGEFKTVFVSEDIAYVMDALNSPTLTGVPAIDTAVRFIRDYLVGIPKQFITSTLGFLAKNITRDTITRQLSSRYRIDLKRTLNGSIALDIKDALVTTNRISLLKTKRNNIGLTPEEESLLIKLQKEKANSDQASLELMGGTMAGYYATSSKSHYETIKALKDEFIKDGSSLLWKYSSALMSPIKTWKSILSSTENATRLLEFKRVYNAEFSSLKEQFINEGMSISEAEMKADYHAKTKAAFEAKDLMDFTIAGKNMGIINAIFMFNNPAIQGLNRTIKSFAGGNKAGAVGVASSMVISRLIFYSALGSAMEAMWSSANDDDENRENQPSYLTDTFWTFKVGANSYFRVPKPFEFGLVSSAMSRAIDQYNGSNVAWDGFAGSIMNTIPPAFKGVTGLSDNPFAQLFTNRDEFQDKDIVPYSEKDLDLSLRNTKYSTKFSRDLADIINVDPRRIDHFWKKTFSDWGDLSLGLYEAATDESVDAGDAFKRKHLGVFTETPFMNSKPYEKLGDLSSRYGVSWNSNEYDKLRELESSYRDADTHEQKEKYAEAANNEVKKIIARWEPIIAKDGNLGSIGGKKTEEQKKKSEKKSSSSSSSRGGSR